MVCVIKHIPELILEFLSTLRFGEVLLDLDAPGTIQFQFGRARRRMSWRQFILALGLHTAEEMELPGPPPSYPLIRDLVLRLCHRMMAHSIAGRIQAPKKVTVTGLFYLRARLAEHFGLLTEERLRGLTVALGPKRQPDATTGALGVAEDAPVVNEGDQVVSAVI
ncbi:hypothetical protein Tco_0432528 [Tanacetum coccineum]